MVTPDIGNIHSDFGVSAPFYIVKLKSPYGMADGRTNGQEL